MSISHNILSSTFLVIGKPGKSQFRFTHRLCKKPRVNWTESSHGLCFLSKLLTGDFERCLKRVISNEILTGTQMQVKNNPQIISSSSTFGSGGTRIMRPSTRSSGTHMWCWTLRTSLFSFSKWRWWHWPGLLHREVKMTQWHRLRQVLYKFSKQISAMSNNIHSHAY